MNFYCQSTSKGKPTHGVIGDMSKKYNVSRKTISRLWEQIKHQQQQNQFPINVNIKRIGKKSRTEIPFDDTKFKGHNSNFKFNDMSNVVHINEKLFYLTRTQHTYYLTPGEVELHREIQSKRYLLKIMFMCVVARPIFSNEGELIFDGKIDIFPFIQEVPAQRSSKNRKRRELETKPIQSITKNHTRDMIVHKILSSIRCK